MYIIMLGAPGAGKGTQAELLVHTFCLCHVSTGDLFRETVAKGGELAEAINSRISKGELVPDELTVQVVMEHLKSPACAPGVVFDGFPRTLNQGKMLTQALAAEAKKIDLVLYIDVPISKLWERLNGRMSCPNCLATYHLVYRPPRIAGICDHCGSPLYHRADDSDRAVSERRMSVYLENTAPLVQYYQDQGALRTVRGERGILQVAGDVIATTLEVAHMYWLPLQPRPEEDRMVGEAPPAPQTTPAATKTSTS
jgi:adenylate kinase